MSVAARCLVSLCTPEAGWIFAVALLLSLGAATISYAQAVEPASPVPAEQHAPDQGSTAPNRDDTKLPTVVVHAAKPKPPAPRRATQPAANAAPAANGEATPAQAALDSKMKALDQARENLLPKTGATSYTISREAIVAAPQGDNTPIDKVILQLPGVSYDSAVSNPNYHVRNEYGNVQYRINGIVLPEGVSSLGPVIDTNFVSSLSLLTGTLPAQYGLRTAGVIDITSRAFAAPAGEVSLYGGSRGTITPSFDYGGSFGDTEYFVTGRGNWNNLGIENPTASLTAIHDHTDQGKFFGYASTLLDPSTRFSVISAASYSAYQIPNNPNQTPLGDFGPANANSSNINENEYDTYIVNIAALQTKGDQVDTQLAVYNRYAQVHFVPDIFNDLVFNDVASDVSRESVMSGTQFDASYQVNDQHKVRTGFAISAEQTNVKNVSTVLPLDSMGNPIPTPITINDANSLLGWNIGTYVQDAWKLTRTLTLNYGLRFDQLYQFVDANQVSPRVALEWRPFDGTLIHGGYARYFTPPYQAQATQSNIALFANTTNAPDVPLDNPVKPERSNYYDIGIDQTVLPGLIMGVDAYYKTARDQIDDGQFGAALVLTQFNFARGFSEGGEYKLKYTDGNFNAYANFSYNITEAIGPESSQYLIDAPDYNYLLTHWHYTDDMQRMTGSAGASYRWNDTLFTTNLIYGSGLRTGDLEDNGVAPNSLHTPAYVVVNVGVAHDFKSSPDAKPLTVRFDIVNLFDEVYELRTGSGIGEFAPQFGARRGFYAGVTQKF